MKGIYDTVTCDSDDGKGCGFSWLEWIACFRIKCPRCGRLVKNGNVIINDDTAPDVTKLMDPRVLVVFEEREEL